MSTEVAVGAAIACAACNAGAAVLQKVSTDKATALRTYNIGVIYHLLKQWPYALGLCLDFLAGVCTLVAVNRLPLFAVEAIIACCVVLTAFLERFFLKRVLPRQTYYASGVVLIGLICIALASHAEPTASVSGMVRDVILAAPLLMLIVGGIAVRLQHKASAFILAALSGCAFGGVSIIGRILTYPHPLWLVAKNDLLWGIIAYGALGMFFFTAALQRSLATIVNGVMTSVQTLVPLVIGIVVLGDTARNGLWLSVWLGCLLVTAGCVYIAATDR